jgi:carboxyl-terminal processing protease
MKMKKIKILLPLFILFLVTNSCYEDLDDNASTTQNINDFVWKAMNATYLYKSDIPDLANDRFTSDDEYRNYLNSFSSPESIFESLKYLPQTVDRFSVIFNNYFDVLNAQEAIRLQMV